MGVVTLPRICPVWRTKSPKIPAQRLFIVAHKLIKCPARVKKSSLMISPNAVGTKSSPSSAPLATTRHLRKDDTASASKDSRTIQTMHPKKIAQIIHRFAQSHPTPLRDA